MDNTNTLSQKSIETLNDFLSNLNRELDTQKAQAENEYNERVRLAYKRFNESAPTINPMSYVSSLCESFFFIVMFILKMSLVMFVMLSPFIIDSLIERIF